jgi:hypothetical protein
MKRIDPKMLIIGALPVMLILAGIISFTLGSNSLMQFKRFKINFAETMAFAQDYNCLRAEYNGVSVRVNSQNATGIYHEVINGGFLFYVEKMPEDGGITLDFGNGDLMRLWSGGTSGILVKYTNTEGYEIYYRTRDISRFISLERLVSEKGSAGPNELWDANP